MLDWTSRKVFPKPKGSTAGQAGPGVLQPLTAAALTGGSQLPTAVLPIVRNLKQNVKQGIMVTKKGLINWSKLHHNSDFSVTRLSAHYSGCSQPAWIPNKSQPLHSQPAAEGQGDKGRTWWGCPAIDPLPLHVDSPQRSPSGRGQKWQPGKSAAKDVNGSASWGGFLPFFCLSSLPPAPSPSFFLNFLSFFLLFLQPFILCSSFSPLSLSFYFI